MFSASHLLRARLWASVGIVVYLLFVYNLERLCDPGGFFGRRAVKIAERCAAEIVGVETEDMVGVRKLRAAGCDQLRAVRLDLIGGDDLAQLVDLVRDHDGDGLVGGVVAVLDGLALGPVFFILAVLHCDGHCNYLPAFALLCCMALLYTVIPYMSRGFTKIF
nr:MAG TPA: hypothetical protein [Caudoviricetes sp.]